MIGLIFCYLQKKQEYQQYFHFDPDRKKCTFHPFWIHFLCSRKVTVFLVIFHLWILLVLPTVQFFFVLSVKNTVLPVQSIWFSITRNGSTIAFNADFAGDSHFDKKWETSCASFFSSTDISIRKTTEEITKAFPLYYQNDMSDKLN